MFVLIDSIKLIYLLNNTSSWCFVVRCCFQHLVHKRLLKIIIIIYSNCIFLKAFARLGNNNMETISTAAASGMKNGGEKSAGADHVIVDVESPPVASNISSTNEISCDKRAQAATGSKRRGKRGSVVFAVARAASKWKRNSGMGTKETKKIRPNKSLSADAAIKLLNEMSENDGRNSLTSKSIMISYCRRNSEIVKRIHDAFTDAGIGTWIDFQDIPKGVDWWESIKRGIEVCHTCIFCLSKDSLESKVCGEELDHMLGLSKKIVPCVVADDFEWDAVRPEIAKLNFIFFDRRTADEANPISFQETFAELREAAFADFGYIELHTKFSAWALEWDRNGRKDGVLLGGDYIGTIDAFLEKSETVDPAPTVVMEDFFAASQAKDLKDKRLEQIASAMLEDEDDANADGSNSSVARARKRIRGVLNNNRVQMVILCLILIDVVLGFASIGIDLSIDDEERKKHIENAMWPVALAFLFIFEIEILLQWFATGFFTFFHHPGFILDLVVISVSLGLEFAKMEGIPQILTVLRAWRVARVFNVAKLSLKREIFDLKQELLLKNAELRKCKRLVRGLKNAEKRSNDELNKLKRNMRLEKKSSSSQFRVSDDDVGKSTFFTARKTVALGEISRRKIDEEDDEVAAK